MTDVFLLNAYSYYETPTTDETIVTPLAVFTSEMAAQRAASICAKRPLANWELGCNGVLYDDPRCPFYSIRTLALDTLVVDGLVIRVVEA